MKYVCVCGYEYDPAVGDPDGGIAPGTPFEDIPDDWVCPVCGLGKDAFSPEEWKKHAPPVWRGVLFYAVGHSSWSLRSTAQTPGTSSYSARLRAREASI